MKRLLGVRPIQILPLGFLGIILLGSALLCLPLASRSGQPLPFIDALFTSTSATCVTGLAIGDTGSTFSLFGQIVILIQIQIGGLGFMTMASVLFSLVHKRISLYERMTLMESMGENRLTDITSTAAMAVRLTFITEGIGAFLLAIRFIPLFGLAKGLWYSVFHSISAFCNAGFDIFGTGLSLEGLFTGDIFVNLVVMGLVIVGGLGFTVVYELCSRPRQRRLRLHTRIVLVATGILIVLGWVMFCVLEWDGAYNALPGGTRVLAGLFQSVTLRTAGFATVNQASLGGVSKLVSLLWMMIGGSPCGTAGGLKTTTFVVLLLAVRSAIRGSGDITVSNRRIAQPLVLRAFALLTAMVGCILTATVLISFFERGNSGFDTMSLLFEITSAVCTVGVTAGLSEVAAVGSQLVLIGLMFLGRVGLLTVALSLMHDRDKPLIRYPDAELPIG